MKKMKKGILVGILSPCLGLAALIDPRISRAADAADATASAPEASLEEIVVTAEKRSESALTTPIALSVFSGDSLKQAQVYSALDLQNIDPSVNISFGGFGATATVRGVTSVDGTSKGTPGIAFNVDGIAQNRGYEQATAFFDLERVEVLKGPQGTLYGQSSTGGAINIITAKPKDVFEASADLTYGDFNTRRLDGMVNIPVSDMLAFRAAVNSNAHDAYLTYQDGTPANNDASNLSSRLSALVTFTPDITFLLQTTNGSVGGLGPGQANYQTLLTQPTGSAQRVVDYNPFAHNLNDRFSDWDAQLNWTIGPVRASYVGGYFRYWADEKSSSTFNPLADPNGSNTPPYTAFAIPEYDWRDYLGHFWTDSQELRLSNSNPGPVDWVAGVNYFKENVEESDHNWTAQANEAGVYPTIPDSLNAIDPVNTTTHTAKGVFGQLTWHAIDRLDVIAGVRYTEDTLKRVGYFAAGPFGSVTPSGGPCIAPSECLFAPGGVPILNDNGAEKDNKVTYKAGVNYHFTPTQMLYADVSTGFKGGGFNDPSPANNFVAGTYAPEQLTAYEIGYKGRPVENFEFNSDLFYYDYSKRQVSSLIEVNGAAVIQTTTAPAVIEGWENEFTFKPTHDDEVHLNTTYLKSYYVRLTENDPAGAPVSLAGRSLDLTPRFVATLGYSHFWTAPNGGTVRAHVDFKYSTDYLETNLSPVIGYTQDAFTRTSLDLRYTEPTGKWYVAGYVQNLENKLQITSPPGGEPTPGVPNGQSVGVTDPRTFGVTLGVKF